MRRHVVSISLSRDCALLLSFFRRHYQVCIEYPRKIDEAGTQMAEFPTFLLSKMLVLCHLCCRLETPSFTAPITREILEIVLPFCGFTTAESEESEEPSGARKLPPHVGHEAALDIRVLLKGIWGSWGRSSVAILRSQEP